MTIRIAVVSGKGGVGKTNLVANIAVAAAGLGAKMLVVDGDLGLANVDVLLGLTPELTAADVIEGRCRFEDALLTGPGGIHILPAASGRSDLPGFRPERLATWTHAYDVRLLSRTESGEVLAKLCRHVAWEKGGHSAS